MPEHLRQALRDGDPEALREVMRELSEPVYRYVRPQVGDGQVAQDVVQQTFIRLWKHRKRLKQEGSLRTYCFFIATNLVRDTRRREALRRKRETEGAEMRQHHDRNELAEEAFEHAMNLPAELREVVLLRFAQGFTALETAEVLGLPEGTVKTRQRSALEKLREKLGVAMAPAVALPDIESSVCVGAKTSVTVPGSLQRNMETNVMATIGTNTGVSITLGAGICVILMAALATLGMYLLFEPEPAAVQPVAESLQPEGADGNTETVNPIARNGGGATEAPDTSPETLEGGEGATGDEETGSDGFTANTLKIRGRVVDQDGNGVAGAWVYEPRPTVTQLFTDAQTELGERFVRMGAFGFEGDVRRIGGMPGQWSLPIGAGHNNKVSLESALKGTSSDADGWFEFYGDEEASGRIPLTVWHEHYYSQGRYFNLHAGAEQIVEETLTVNRHDRWLTFKLDPPVAHDVSTRLNFVEGGGYNSWSVLGQDGQFWETLHRPCKSVHIGVPGYSYKAYEFEDDGTSSVDLGTLKLEPLVGRDVSGTIVDQNGAPISGAVLYQFEESKRISFAMEERSHPAPYAESAPDGSFHFNALSHNAVGITVRHKDYAPVKLTLEPSEEDITNLRVVMQTGVTVSGYVRFMQDDGPKGKSDLTVMLSPERFTSQDPGLTDTTVRCEVATPDESLAFNFDRVPPGDYILRARMQAGNRISPDVRIRVEDSNVYADVIYGGGLQIFGTLIGRDGRPMVDSRVMCLVWEDNPDGYTGWTSFESAITDAEGTYRITDVPPGKYNLFVADHEPNFLILEERIVSVADANVRLDIKLGARPVGNSITATMSIDSRVKFDGLRLYGVGPRSNTRLDGRPDEQGVYRINDIPPGEYWLYGERNNDYPFRQKVVFDGWGETLQLNPTFAVGTQEVTVRNESGELVGATVWLYPLHDVPVHDYRVYRITGKLEHGRATEDGKATLFDVVDGDYVMHVRASGYAVASKVISVSGDGRHDVVVSRAQGSAKLKFVPEPEEHGDLMVYCVDLDRPGRPVVFVGGPHNDYRNIRQLAPGRYQLIVTNSTGGSAKYLDDSTEFEVTADEAVTVEVPLKKAGGVVLQLEGEDLNPGRVLASAVRITNAVTGKSVPGARELRRTDGRSIGIGGLSEGSYSITVHVHGSGKAEVTVEVTSGETRTVNLELKPE